MGKEGEGNKERQGRKRDKIQHNLLYSKDFVERNQGEQSQYKTLKSVAKTENLLYFLNFSILQWAPGLLRGKVW